MKLQISREGKAQDVSVALGELPEKAEKAGAPETGSGGLDGVDVQELTPDIAQRLQLAPGARGVVVTSVDPASAAAAVDLEQGDVIQEVNHKPVASIEQYRQALAGIGNQSVLLLVNRGGVTHYVVVEQH